MIWKETLLKSGIQPEKLRESQAIVMSVLTSVVEEKLENQKGMYGDLKNRLQARELAHLLHMEFLRRGYITDLYNEANPD